MIKERLGEARLMAEMLRVETRLPHDFPFDLVDWLIEQAEQVQELEERVFDLKARLVVVHQYNDALKLIADDYEKQSKRYREVLEKIKLNIKIYGNEEYFPKVVEEVVNEALKGGSNE